MLQIALLIEVCDAWRFYCAASFVSVVFRSRGLNLSILEYLLILIFSSFGCGAWHPKIFVLNLSKFWLYLFWYWVALYRLFSYFRTLDYRTRVNFKRYTPPIWIWSWKANLLWSLNILLVSIEKLCFFLLNLVRFRMETLQFYLN